MSESKNDVGRGIFHGGRLSGDMLAKIFILLIVTGPILAYTLPENVLSRWPIAAAFADFVARYVPSIDKFTAISQFPQVTRLFLALLWGVIAPAFLVACLMTTPQANHLRRMQAPEWAVWTAPLAAVAMFWVVLFMPFVEVTSRAGLPCGPTPFEEGICLLSDSRLWMGLFCTLYVLAADISVVAMILWPKAIRTYYQNKSK